MLNKILIFLLLISSLTACITPKTVYIKPEPFAFQQTEEPAQRNIRIYKDDIELYKAYTNSMRNKLKFHNQQIADYFKHFEK
jgi:hypothetical protein